MQTVKSSLSEVIEPPKHLKLFEIIEMKQRLFLVMELVLRVDMHRYLNHQGRLSENEARGMS